MFCTAVLKAQHRISRIAEFATLVQQAAHASFPNSLFKRDSPDDKR